MANTFSLVATVLTLSIQVLKMSILREKMHQKPQFYTIPKLVVTKLLVISHGAHDGFIMEVGGAIMWFVCPDVV